MRKLFSILLLLNVVTGSAQVYNPIKWTTSVVKISELEYDLLVKATIEKGWHLYSQEVPKDGPKATKFSFEGNSNYLKKGNTKEEEGHVVDDPIYEMKIKYFTSRVIFKQRIKLKSKKVSDIRGTVEFMVCDDTRCLPPKEMELFFKIK